MGQVKVFIELENYADKFMFQEKKISENQIRNHATEALVDTGAVMLMLPQDITEEL